MTIPAVGSGGDSLDLSGSEATGADLPSLGHPLVGNSEALEIRFPDSGRDVVSMANIVPEPSFFPANCTHPGHS